MQSTGMSCLWSIAELQVQRPRRKSYCMASLKEHWQQTGVELELRFQLLPVVLAHLMIPTNLPPSLHAILGCCFWAAWRMNTLSVFTAWLILSLAWREKAFFKKVLTEYPWHIFKWHLATCGLLLPNFWCCWLRLSTCLCTQQQYL